jgi:hypothetical protein
VQKALNIGAEGCFVLSVKNPQALPYSSYSATLPPRPTPSSNPSSQQGIPLPSLDGRSAVQQVRTQTFGYRALTVVWTSQMIHDQPGLPRSDPSTVPQSPLHIEFPPHLQEAFQGRMQDRPAWGGGF